MSLANDSILVTPGSGATVATQLVSSKEHQVVMIANANGHILDTLETWYFWSTYEAGAANEILLDIFNATGSGKVIKVRKLYVHHNQAAVVGIGVTCNVDKTSAVGTGGTTITPQPADSTNTALPAQITCRHAATGGATSSGTLFGIALNPEETLPAASIACMINWIPEGPTVQEIVIRENQGFRVQQITSSTVPVWGIFAVCTVE